MQNIRRNTALNKTMHRFTGAFLLAMVASLLIARGTSADELSFNREIRPILSDKCNFCHGPDEETREADLRFDQRESAIDVIESGELLDRINSDDDDYRMPPPHAKLTLSAEEKQLLKKWAESGAPYEKHWAFELLPDSVDIPKVDNEKWCKQELDHFVLAQIEDAKLSPTKEASALRWLRRVHFDLTGLPPTLQQIRRFQKELEANKETAYEAAADRLLDSVAYGEHMAVGWLDLARYADSYGYQSDKLNTQWPYRDWVVRAFNDNLPYNKFLTWQLAGDLLENPTRDQRLATAFNRIHRLNNEGGAVFEEWRIENVSDRVHTFGTAILGLTMECCRCHDHKYDPIPMREYYSLSAFFNSIDESGVYDRTAKVPCPSMLLPTEKQAQSHLAAIKKAKNADAKLQQAVVASKDLWKKWKSEQDTTSPPSIPDLRLALSFDEPFNDEIKKIYHPSENDRGWTKMLDQVAVPDLEIPRLSISDAGDIVGKSKTTKTAPDPPGKKALSLDGQRGITTHGIEPLDRWMRFSVVVTFRETKRVPERSLLAHHTRGTDCGYNGWDLTIVDGHVESRMYRVWPGNAIGVRTTDPIPADQWHQLAATYDGSSKANGLKLFLNGKALATEVLRDKIKKSANVKVDHGGEFVIGQRFRARGLDGGLVDDVRLYKRNLTTPELRYLATGDFEATAEYYASAIDEKCRSAVENQTAARHKLVLAEEAMLEIPIMHEMGEERETHLLARGEYDAETDDSTRVQRSVLSQLPLAFPKDAPQDRLGLAQWVTHPSHPLTSRVAVNHLWANFFSAPLVRTPENFGLQGELPTHPKLLDWIARDFIQHGWDVKRLCRKIVLSATYRQDSAATPEAINRDPENRLLARGPAHRLSAEQIRDLALATSGLLNAEVGGPPVSPYQPGDDLWKEANGMSPPYQQSVGKSLHRRSLYSVWKRTVPLPNMMAFDTTTREVCTVNRSRTNTPLQALVLLNDVQFVEAARNLAEEVLTKKMKKPSVGNQIRVAFRRMTGRNPDQRERNLLKRLYEEELKHFSAKPETAKEFVRLGETERNPDIEPVQLAAMTSVCQAILNLDATVWKR